MQELPAYLDNPTYYLSQFIYSTRVEIPINFTATVIKLSIM